MTVARGVEVLETPLLNKGTAFTATERAALGLEGLLPSAVLSLDQQAERAYVPLRAQPSDLAKNVYLESLHDNNEVLYYRLLANHLRELLPIVYDPTVGQAIKRYSHEYRRPRGVYLSIDQTDQVEAAFANFELNAFRPIIISNVLHSVRILGDLCDRFRRFLVEGAKLNRAELAGNIDRSVMMVTALSPVIGYDQASKIAHLAIDQDLTLKQAALRSGVSEELFDRVVIPENLTRPGTADAPTGPASRSP